MFLVLVMIFANLFIRGPDLKVFLTTPSTSWFTGQVSWFDPWDINVYLTAINWGRQGHILLNNRYDPNDNSHLLLYPFYTFAGFFTSPLPLSPALTFHLLGVLVSLGLIYYLWQFTHLFFSSIPKRRVALILLVFGGGLGWLVFPTQSTDLSFGGFTLHAALRIPHEGLSLILFLLALQSFYQAKPKTFTLALIGLSLIHPYMFLPLGLIIGIYILIHLPKTKLSPMLIYPSLIGLITLVYYLLIGREFLQSVSYHTLTHQTFPPLSPLELVFGFGLLLIPIIYTFLHRQTIPPRFQLLIIWFVCQLILTLTLPIGRLLVRGLWIPAAILATQGLFRLIHHRRLRVGLVGLACLSTIYIAVHRTTDFDQSPWVHLSQMDLELINQMPCGENQVVLASRVITNLIPTFTTCRGFTGHQIQSPQFRENYSQVLLLLSGELSATDAAGFLAQSHVNYIFWSPAEQTLAQRLDFPYPQLAFPILSLSQSRLYQISNQPPN